MEFDYSPNQCLDCLIKFSTPHELLNHKNRFCINSGYDSLHGLTHIQNQTGPYQIARQDPMLSRIALHPDDLEVDMKKINNFKRNLEGKSKYYHNSKVSEDHHIEKSSNIPEQNLSYSKYSSTSSQLEKHMERYEKSATDAISPPTFIEQNQMNQQSILGKSNTSIQNMKPMEKINYAKAKLDELNQMKDMYLKNGGNKLEFKQNIQKMVDFYQKTIADNHKAMNTSQTSHPSESRLSTPILKLRNYLEQSQAVSHSKANQLSKSSISKKPANISQGLPIQSQFRNNQMNSYSQPQIIMLPYPQQNSNSNESSQNWKALVKMIELKDEENKKLISILMEEKTKNQESNIKEKLQPAAVKKIKAIDTSEEYQFKKSMPEDLISEEKVLLALQQEELDQLKLLSQLPRDLQLIKMKGVAKASQTRFQMEKEILRQKMERLAYQELNQNFQEVRKVQNDEWAGNQRKKLLEKQMNKYVDNYNNEFVTKQEEQVQEIQK